ncbi:hypothetical protein IAR55_005872 [Kwoniella newhampshirensis]|uniref:RNA polymerase II elongation factor ELL N-terminal domain-containing protein n=1 Tax=Kwoniella newhampshirensis TaxID=1651941 RepID=A0AAW0YV97_9TREE
MSFLPTSGSVPLVTTSGSGVQPTKAAFLVKFPEDAWAALQDGAGSGAEVSISVNGGLTLNIPHQPPLKLESRSTGTPSEIHAFTSSPSPSLSLTALASTRLSVPMSSAFTARAADKLKAQNEAIDRERKERAVRVEGSSTSMGKARSKPVERLSASASTTMGRTHSSPTMGTSAAPAVNGNSVTSNHTMIPLKTRVMQLLALGPTSVADIVRRVGGDEQNVMRVVNVVGRMTPTSPPTYTLLPNQYSKIKLGPGQWKYTYAERQQVIRLAREAFDELGLPEDAEERLELDRKEQEAINGYQSSAGSVSSGEGEKPLAALSGLTTAPPSHTAVATVAVAEASTKTVKRTQSPAPGAAKSKATNGTGASKKSAPQSKIAKERAKFLAEQKRSTSLPNVKGVEGTASPRVTPLKGLQSPKEEKNGKRKRDEIDKEGAMRRRASYEYSSDEEEPARGRLAANSAMKGGSSLGEQNKESVLSGGYKIPKKGKVTTASSPIKPPKDIDYSSDDSEEGEIRGRPQAKTALTSSAPNGKRHAPPPLELGSKVKDSSISQTREKVTASLPVPPQSAPIIRSTSYPGSVSRSVSDSASGSRSDRGSSNPDPEALRDRYEELFPAYQQLTKKLIKVHQAAESGLDVGIGEEGVGVMVRKWERWHKELAEIRRWFGEK